eukprot:6466124-Amphidinium_carterae.1
MLSAQQAGPHVDQKQVVGWLTERCAVSACTSVSQIGKPGIGDNRGNYTYFMPATPHTLDSCSPAVVKPPSSVQEHDYAVGGLSNPSVHHRKHDVLQQSGLHFDIPIIEAQLASLFSHGLCRLESIVVKALLLFIDMQYKDLVAKDICTFTIPQASASCASDRRA